MALAVSPLKTVNLLGGRLTCKNRCSIIIVSLSNVQGQERGVQVYG
nr:MAG TPA: hypothetical protein [Bacteriophage sp.]